MPPKDSPGILWLEQGVLMLGLGNMQCKITQQSRASAAAGDRCFIRMALLAGVREQPAANDSRAPAALQGTIAGSYPLCLVNKPGLLCLRGAEPRQPVSAHTTQLRLLEFKLPALCFPLFLNIGTDRNTLPIFHPDLNALIPFPISLTV